MSTNTITPDMLLAQMRAMAAQAQGQSAPSDSSQNGVDFSQLLKKSIDNVNATQQDGAKLAEAFAKGDPNVQLSEVMVSLQKANVSFQAMLEVRNKLVNAYQEIMNMQV